MADYPYPFTPKSVTIDGHRLSYLDEGTGPAIVMLHGNPSWSFFYRNLVLLLRGQFRVIVPDHLGCGLSDKPEDYPYRLENHIHNLEVLLAGLGLDSVSLILHDWGGAIGMGYAGRHPQAIRSLTILNTGAFRSPRMPWRIGVCRVPLLGAWLVRGLNAFAGAAVWMAVRKPLPPEVRRGYLAPYDSWANRIATLRFVQDIPMAADHPSYPTLLAVEEGLDQFLMTPMRIFWGGRDFCFDDHFYNEWRRRFPEAEATYFAEAGHYLLEDAGAEIAPLLLAFYRRVYGS